MQYMRKKIVDQKAIRYESRNPQRPIAIAPREDVRPPCSSGPSMSPWKSWAAKSETGTRSPLHFKRLLKLELKSLAFTAMNLR
jgi:hypothetical protein